MSDKEALIKEGRTVIITRETHARLKTLAKIRRLPLNKLVELACVLYLENAEREYAGKDFTA
jgi:hypothetical protein